VLDKADILLLDLGFKDKIRVIFKYFKEDVQIILLSVPMLKDTLDMNTHFLRNPVCIFMKKEELILEGMCNRGWYIL
jgi:ATP-dependent RNA helicase